MRVRSRSAANRVTARWTGVRRVRVDAQEVGPDVAVAGRRLDGLDARHGRQVQPGRVVGAADDDAELVEREAREEVGGRRLADEAAVVEDRDAVADALDVVEDVGRVEDGRLALQLRT